MYRLFITDIRGMVKVHRYSRKPARDVIITAVRGWVRTEWKCPIEQLSDTCQRVSACWWLTDSDGKIIAES